MEISCPYCTKEIDPKSTQCSSCGTTYGSDTLRFLRDALKRATLESSSERRKLDRVPRKFRIVYPTANKLQEAYLSNVSTGGVFIKTDNPLNRGARFNLKLALPGYEEELEIFCEVVWSSREEWKAEERTFPPGMGIKFLNLSQEGRQRIDHILRRSSEEGGNQESGVKENK
jgi:type IV pilus assembly protein PilZ